MNASLPLILRLKKNQHKLLAKAQDLLMHTLYEFFPDAVLHGGTAIWRCYQGQRFSEDIDAYLPKNILQLSALFDRLKQQGFVIERKKISDQSLYSTLLFQRTPLRFEALFKHVKGILKEYMTVEGNYNTIYTLSPEVLIQEKIAAYTSRRKIRDLYDIFFLLRHVIYPKTIEQHLQKFLTDFQQPLDTQDLQFLIFEGLVPTVTDMLNYIRRFLDHGQTKI